MKVIDAWFAANPEYEMFMKLDIKGKTVRFHAQENKSGGEIIAVTLRIPSGEVMERRVVCHALRYPARF